MLVSVDLHANCLELIFKSSSKESIVYDRNFYPQVSKYDFLKEINLLEIEKVSKEKFHRDLIRVGDHPLLGYYLEFIQGQRKVKQTKALDAIGELSRIETSENSFMKRFRKIVEKVEKRKGQFQESYSGDLAKIRLNSRNFRNAAMQCRSKHSNDLKKKAAKIFTPFLVGMGTGVSVVTFASAQNGEMTSQKWWQIGYELTRGAILATFSARIFANTNNHMFKNWLKSYFLVYRSSALIDIPVFSAFFSGDKKEMEAKLMERWSSPEEKIKLKNLIKIYENPSWGQKFKLELEKWKEIIFSKVSHEELMQNFKIIKEIDEKFELDDETLKDLLILLMIMEEYEATSEERLFSTGDVGIDKNIFTAGYAAVTFPIEAWAPTKIFHIICENSFQPGVAMVKGFGFYILYRFLSDGIWYEVRKRSVDL
ncbi:MAG: hypothetical protein ACPGJV_03275 [Bacteriovoracaceae bacterium]